MKLMIINGGPRVDRNTAALLGSAAKGAAAAGADTKVINLYMHDFKGCYSCLNCKSKVEGKLGHCGAFDGLSPILEEIETCDAILLGSPIYFGEVTGVMRMFLERLLFAYLSYDADRAPLAPHKFNTAFIYTMNVPESALEQTGYAQKFGFYKGLLTRVLGASEYMYATETLQVDDYSQYHMSMFDEAARRKRHDEVFPLDMQKAFEIGQRLVKN